MVTEVTEDKIQVLFELFHTKLTGVRKTRKLYHKKRNKADILAADHLIRSLLTALEDLRKDPQGTYRAFERAVTSPEVDAARTEALKTK